MIVVTVTIVPGGFEPPPSRYQNASHLEPLGLGADLRLLGRRH
jgi:hypothetical protein